MIFDKSTVLTTTTKIIILFLSLQKIPASSFRVHHPHLLPFPPPGDGPWIT